MALLAFALTPAVIAPKSLVGPGRAGDSGLRRGAVRGGGVLRVRDLGLAAARDEPARCLRGAWRFPGLAMFFGLGGSSAAAAVTSATGLTLFLPLWLYVFSTFFFATTAFACLLDPKAFPVGAALIFLLIAGLLPGTSYQQALLVLAMTLLAHEEGVFEMEQLPLNAPAQ